MYLLIVERSFKPSRVAVPMTADETSDVSDADKRINRILSACGAFQLLTDCVLGSATYKDTLPFCRVCRCSGSSDSPLLRCSRCKQVWYCSRNHQ